MIDLLFNIYCSSSSHLQYTLTAHGIGLLIEFWFLTEFGEKTFYRISSVTNQHCPFQILYRLETKGCAKFCVKIMYNYLKSQDTLLQVSNLNGWWKYTLHKPHNVALIHGLVFPVKHRLYILGKKCQSKVLLKTDLNIVR